MKEGGEPDKTETRNGGDTTIGSSGQVGGSNSEEKKGKTRGGGIRFESVLGVLRWDGRIRKWG